jgi:head-tail adaptor
MGLSATALSRMRAVQTAFMDKVVQIQTDTGAQRLTGCRAESWSTSATTVGRKTEIERVAEEQIVAGKPSARVTYRVEVPWGTAVTARNRLVIDGDTLEIAQVPEEGSYATVLTLIATTTR